MTDYKCKNCGKELSWNGLTCSGECSEQFWARKLNERYSPTTLPKTPEARYGHETLHGAVNRAGFQWGRNCSHCGKHHNQKSQYCSNACKQRAYRLRNDPEYGSSAHRNQRAQLGAQTKRHTTIELVCEQCGEKRFWNQAQGTNRQYCSNACKQRAYRQRMKST